MSASMTIESWAVSLLRALGEPVTRDNIQAIVGWENAEGGNWHNQARYNPLNTTQPEPGAGNTGSQGNIKVYQSWQQGLQATVTTLRNGNYGGILAALSQGNNAGAVATAIGASPWGTSASSVQATIAGTTTGGGVTTSTSASGSTTTEPHLINAPEGFLGLVIKFALYVGLIGGGAALMWFGSKTLMQPAGAK